MTAPPVDRVIPKGLLGVSAWTESLLQKYLYHRATRNLLTEMKHQGMPISPGTVYGGLKRLSGRFQPMFEGLLKHRMGEQAFHCDETGWKVHEPLEGKAGNRWWLWVFRSESVVICRLEPTRSSEVPTGRFQGLCPDLEEAFVIGDRHGACERLSTEIDSIILNYCWSHCRRDHLDVATKCPQLESRALDWLQRIVNLYHRNHCRLKHWNREQALADQSESFQSEQRLLEQAVKTLEQTGQSRLSRDDLHPAQRKMLKSMQSHWTGLTVLVKHPEIRMDNNLGEQAMRGPAMLRKNCRGSGSVWSAGLASILFSIFQTLLQWKINPSIGCTSI